MMSVRWELRAVLWPLDDDDGDAAMWEALIRSTNSSPPRFLFRRRADSAARFFDGVFPGVAFYVVPARLPARRMPPAARRR